LRRVYFAVFGSGLGHATRALDIAAPLGANGGSVRYSCFGQGYRYMVTHKPGVDAIESPALDVEWTEEGSFSSRDFVVHFPRMVGSFVRQLAFEEDRISDYKPSVVVSDSRLSAVLAGWSRRYPVVTMLNQFMVTLPPRYRKGRLSRLYERIAGDVLGLLWSLSDQVLLTDLPPPYTIGEANVAGTDVSRIVKYVGFTTPGLELDQEKMRHARTLLNGDGRPLVFFQVSGPDATKKRFVDTVLKSTASLTAEYNVVVSLGYLGGSGEPRRLADGTILYDWCPIKDELFALSDVMVARSGHRTIGQCIDAVKPAVLIPIHNHSEQLGNAEKFERLGLGVALSPGDFDATKLTESVETCMRDGKYRKNLEAVAAVSSRYRGVERCAEIISSYS
jgi:UDP-N-acetylglucosamine--N-acetylmuramyl-(pentapeptide) pyrophosphoryl-undecaprenol N-acetylglucosamine transferase